MKHVTWLQPNCIPLHKVKGLSKGSHAHPTPHYTLFTYYVMHTKDSVSLIIRLCRHALAVTAIAVGLDAKAQSVENNAADINADSNASLTVSPLPLSTTPAAKGMRHVGMDNLPQLSTSLATDSMATALNTGRRQRTLAFLPMTGRLGSGLWQVHEGLNLNVGAAVFTQLGSGRRKGVGLQQDLNMLYVVPINNRLFAAGGFYLNNINWGGSNMRNVGVSAVAGYKFDEHWEAYVYGQKSITGNAHRFLGYMPYSTCNAHCGMGGIGGFSNFYGMPTLSPYDLDCMGDRLGATVRYNFNSSTSIEVSIETRSMKP